ncbi:MAG: glycosyltransferase family 2 protein [Psychrilyobacter sp.]|nr:glycosyltransferase family 2 protein [Psychrilyobacter sp.]
MNTKVAVILPTYKPQDYIIECFKSLEIQTLKKNEFCVYIGLNGSSKEFEKYILDQLKNFSFKYKFLFIENPGVSNARNKLLDVSMEDYIVFVDDDDIISKYYLEELLELTDEKTLGISDSKNFIKEISCLEENPWGKLYKTLKLEEKSKFKVRRYFSCPVSKMIHRKMVENYKFDINLKLGEDTLFMTYISKNIDLVKKTSENACYYIRVRETSSSRRHGGKWNKIKASFYSFRQFVKIFFTAGYEKLFLLTRIVALVKYILQK